jgi:hypothetical protein
MVEKRLKYILRNHLIQPGFPIWVFVQGEPGWIPAIFFTDSGFASPFWHVTPIFPGQRTVAHPLLVKERGL